MINLKSLQYKRIQLKKKNQVIKIKNQRKKKQERKKRKHHETLLQSFLFHLISRMTGASSQISNDLAAIS
jgi:hypothetical protein